MVLNFLLVALVPLVCMGAFNYSKSKTALKKQILSGLEDVAYGAIDRISQAMRTSHADVHQWAEFAVVKEGLKLGSFARVNGLFRDLTRNNKLYRAIILFDKQGKLMATSDPALMAKSEYEQRMEFDQEYIEGALGEHLVSVGNFRYSDLIGDYTVSFSSLVRDERREPIGVITLFINWAMVQEFATGERIRGDEGRVGMLLGSDGQTIIAYHDPSFISTPLQYLYPTQLSDLTSLGEERGSGEIEIRGVRKCVAFHRGYEFQDIKLFNWTCLVFVDSEMLLTPINILKYNVLIFVFVVIGSVLVTIYFVAGGIINPLGSFTTAATRATEAGDLTQQVEVKTEDEIGQLSKSFQQMMNWMKEMAGIATSIAGGNLDQRVEVKSEKDTFGKAFQSMVVSLKNTQEAMQREKQSVQRLAEEREVVARIGRIIGSTLEIEEVYKHFAEEVRKIIPFDRIAISLVYPEKATLLIAHITGKEVPGYRPGDVAPLAGTITEETMRKRSSQLIQTDNRDEVVKHFPSMLPSFQAGLRSFIAVPLISKDQVIGVLHVFSARLKAYTEADIELAESIGSQIAGAIANAQLYAERKRAEERIRESEEKYRASFDNASDAINVFSKDRKIVDVNKKLTKLSGYSKKELLSMEIKDLYPEAATPKTGERLKKLLQGKEVPVFETHLLTKKGKRIPVELAVTLLKNCYGQEIVFQSNIRDITERKRAEEELRKYRDHLEELVEERTAELVRANEQLQRQITEREAAEEALRVSEERFALAVRGSNDGIYDWDIQNNTLYWSPRLKEMLEYADDDLDVDFDTLILHLHPDDKELTQIAIEAHLKDRIPYQVEHRLRAKSGEYRWFLTRGEAVWDDAGKPIRMVGSTNDITERKRAEEELRKYHEQLEEMVEERTAELKRTNEKLEGEITERKRVEEEVSQLSQFRESIIENANVWLNVLDEKGNIMIHNKAAEEISGYSREEVVGHDKIWEWLYPDKEYRNQIFGSALARIEKGEDDKDRETTIRCKDGQTRIISWDIRTLVDEKDNRIRSIALGRDITEHRRAEEEVKDTNRRLIREMREKEEFLRIVSHDLGAPVRNISGMAASILRKYGGKVGEDVRDRLMRIQRNAEHELGLIQDLLELSRIKTRRERFEEVDLGALVKGVGDGLSHQLEEKGITFKVAEELPAVICERKRMMQVFQNLIDNACKYMDSNGGPRIEVGFEELGDSYRFSVSDNGIGIKEEDQERIFYVFNRLKNPTTSQVEGKGVGLSAVKAIVEAYGGEVWVESPPKRPRKGKGAKGSTFYFTLAKDALRGRDDDQPGG